MPFDGTKIKFRRHNENVVSSSPSLTYHGPDYIGYVDTAHAYGICGWAADRNRLNTSINVSLYDNDTPIATVLANLNRLDVGAYLGDNGLHGFTIPIP